MTSAIKTHREFMDTTDSFRPSPQFTYHYKKGECEYKRFLEHQSKELTSILQEGVPSKQKLQEVFRHLEREADSVIGELLTQTTQLRKKMKIQHEQYEAIVREQKCKIRKLAQENLYLTSDLQLKEKSLHRVVQQLKNHKNGQSQEANKQIAGLQALLAEYQEELCDKDTTISELRKECSQQISLYEECKSEIFNQTRESEQLKQIVQVLKQKLATQQMIMKADENHQLGLMIEHDQALQEKLKQKNHEIYLLTNSEKQLATKVTDLYTLVSQLKKQAAKEQKERLNCQERQNTVLRKIKTTYENALKALKEKYETKIVKISDLLRKELKKAKKQIQAMKIAIPKEIYSCLKETKGFIFSEMPCKR